MSNCPVGEGRPQNCNKDANDKENKTKNKTTRRQRVAETGNMDTIFKNRKQDLANMGAGGSILNGFNFQRVGKKIGMKSPRNKFHNQGVSIFNVEIDPGLIISLKKTFRSLFQPCQNSSVHQICKHL